MKKSPKSKTKKTKAASTTSRTAAKSSSKKISKKTPKKSASSTVSKLISTKVSKKTPKKSTGAVFFKKNPVIFDKRLSEMRRFESITSAQWKEYVKDLKCAVCGVPGGKCNCKPEDLEDEIENVQA